MDLVKMITEKVKEFEDNGSLDKVIEKNVSECIESIVSESFRWSGEAKKSLENGLKGKLEIDFNNLQVHRYQKIVGDIIDTQLNDTITENLRNQIKESVDEITTVLEKKEWKLSEIIAKYVDDIDKSYDGGMGDQYGELSFHCEKNGNFVWIRWDNEPDKEHYLCKNSMHLYKGKLAGVTLDEKPMSPFSTQTMSHMEEFFFKLYCNNVEVIVDDDKVETEYYREDCD